MPEGGGGGGGVHVCVHINLHMYEHCAQHQRRKQGGGGGQDPPPPPQYFTLETLLIFIHAEQIAASQCILRLVPPKWNCFLHLCTAQMYFVLLVLFPG